MRRRLLPSLEEEEVEEPLINLTPLIDVVFVLLITFMLIAPILNVDHVDLAASGTTSKKEAAHTPLAITLRSDNSIWFQGNRLPIEQLESIMKREKILHPGQCPQLIADKNAYFGMYQEVKNVVEACGFEQMDVVLQ